jgi:hypothetical protein
VSVILCNGLSRCNLLPPMTMALLSLSILASTASLGSDQSVLGAGNQAAQQLAARSPLVSSAMALITQRVVQIAEPTLRSATLDGVTNPLTCVAHRVGTPPGPRTRISLKPPTPQLCSQDVSKFR